MYKLPENCGGNTFLIDSDGNEISYSTFLESQSEFQKKIDSRVVILVLNEATVGSVMGLISFLVNGQVPLLIEPSTDIELMESLLSVYKIEYIFVAEDKQSKFPDFKEVTKLCNFVLLKTGFINDQTLNKDLALLLNTSGSTGSPKLVRLSYGNVIANGHSIIEYLKIVPEDRAITTLPLSYSFGFSILNSHVLAGASIVLTEKSIIERGFWDTFAKCKPTSLSGVPFTFEMLQKMKFFSRVPQTSLRVITQAGGKMSNEMIAGVDKFSKDNNIDFYVMYGQTEATARISYVDPSYTSEKMGSIGKAIPGGQLNIIPTTEDPKLGLGGFGELIYTGPNVMMGYANNRLDLSRGDELNGVLKTGDIAIVDDDGFHWIVGRIKRFLKIHGKRVNLDEVESIINRDFSPVVCLGFDDKLEIFTCDYLESLNLKQFVVSKFNISSLAITINLVEAIPRFDNGKINYKLLEDQING
jgi:long-chain acyl-CoA synthetase